MGANAREIYREQHETQKRKKNDQQITIAARTKSARGRRKSAKAESYRGRQREKENWSELNAV